MSGAANYPTALDDDTSLLDVTDGVSTLVAAHHNNIKEAVKALEARVGVIGSTSPTSIEYRLGSPTAGHLHNGASGQGQIISASDLGFAVYAHGKVQHQGSLPAVATNAFSPMSLGRTVQLISLRANLRVAPSGATTALNLRVGGSQFFAASPGLRPIFPPGATSYGNASPNFITIPSGAVMAFDVDAVGSNNPGQDLSITFIFRE
jgi:hypothetical protein